MQFFRFDPRTSQYAENPLDGGLIKLKIVSFEDCSVWLKHVEIKIYLSDIRK